LIILLGVFLAIFPRKKTSGKQNAKKQTHVEKHRASGRRKKKKKKKKEERRKKKEEEGLQSAGNQETAQGHGSMKLYCSPCPQKSGR
jgi:hypothetical protein